MDEKARRRLRESDETQRFVAASEERVRDLEAELARIAGRRWIGPAVIFAVLVGIVWLLDVLSGAP